MQILLEINNQLVWGILEMR